MATARTHPNAFTATLSGSNQAKIKNRAYHWDVFNFLKGGKIEI
jgi:hypothetical protein